MKDKRCCGNCKFSRWELTPTGRISNYAGRCVVELPVINLPWCVTQCYSFRRDYPRCGLGPKDGTECPLFEVNDGKPI
jgi:hypothetical protein